MTEHYAVVGNPVAHSISPRIHTEFARQTAQDLDYVRLLAPLAGFAGCVEDFQARGGSGVNITLPFKLDAFQWAVRRSERATIAQAVNTLRFDDSGAFGDNTDGIGLTRDIEANLQFAVAGKRVLLLGAGGAARGVLLPLLERRPAALVIANRTPHKAQALAQQFVRHGKCAACGFADLSGATFDLVINATSASVSGAVLPLPEKLFATDALAYDMMYGKVPTPFMKFAGSHGAAQVVDGLGMLVEQAAEAFFVWRGVRPVTASVLATLRTQD